MITVMTKPHLLLLSSLLFPPDELPPWLNIWSKAIKSQRGFPVITLDSNSAILSLSITSLQSYRRWLDVKPESTSRQSANSYDD